MRVSKQVMIDRIKGVQQNLSLQSETHLFLEQALVSKLGERGKKG